VQPVELAIPDSGSAVVQVMVIFDVYQPFCPTVPLTVGVTTGGVTSGGSETANVWVTCGAAPYPGPAAWSAATVHWPAATNETVPPPTVQTVAVRELKVTAFPDAPPVALTAYDWPTIAGLGGFDENTIDCGASTG